MKLIAMIYLFEDFEFDISRMELRRRGSVIPIEPQVFSLLELLITQHNRFVSKDEINEIVWGGRSVSDSALSSRIKSARKALNDNGKSQRLIKTVHNRGFRFLATPTVQVVAPTSPDPNVENNEKNVVGRPDQNYTVDMRRLDSVDDGRKFFRDRPTIAVLPFEKLGHDVRLEVLSKAVSYELILELSRLRWLYVIARGSSFRFDPANYDFNEVRQSLNADYVLTGAMEILGNKSVVDLELFSTLDGRVIWMDRRRGTLDDLMTLRGTIAAQVVSALEVWLQTEEVSRTASMATEQLDAWSAYHRGLNYMYRFNKQDNARATALFQQAIKADVSFARAYAGLSFTHYQNAFLNYVPDLLVERKNARQAAEKGFEIDPLDPFVNLSIGRASLMWGDFVNAQSWLERSRSLSPNYALAKFNIGLLKLLFGDSHACEENVRSALLLSPLDPLKYGMLCTLGISYLVRGDYKEASLYCTQGASEPNAHIHIHAVAAAACHLAGNQKAAARWAAKVNKVKPENYRQQLFQKYPFYDKPMYKILHAAFEDLSI